MEFRTYIRHEGDEKYIVAKVVERGNEDEGFIAVVSDALLYHSDIYDKFNEELKVEGKYRIAKVMGGGIMIFNPEDKFIKTYGRSGGYGRPSEVLVEDILRNSYPDWNLDITVTSYIRG